MNQYNRTEERLPFQKECTLANRSGSIETQTVDMSEIGLRVKTDRTLPFKIGSELAVFIPSMDITFLAELMWTKKDSDNATKLGLKLLAA
jgi:hypothetical protein